MGASEFSPQSVPLTCDDLRNLRRVTQVHHATTGLTARVLIRWALDHMPHDALRAAVGDEIELAAEKRRATARAAAAARWGTQKKKKED